MSDDQEAFNNFSNVYLVLQLVFGATGPEEKRMPSSKLAKLHWELEQRAGKFLENNPTAWMDWLLGIKNYTDEQKKELMALRNMLAKDSSSRPHKEIYDVMAVFK